MYLNDGGLIIQAFQEVDTEVGSPWVVLTEASDDLEADIIIGFLRDRGVPAEKADSSPYTGAMRVISGMAIEVQVIVPEKFYDEAIQLIDNLEGGSDQ
jgi:transposase